MRTPFFIFFTILALLVATFVGLIAYWTYTPPNLPSERGGNETISPPLGGGVRGGAIPSRPVISSTDPVRGDSNAPLTIVEFGDFLCEACAEVEPVLQKVLKEYAGKVKLVWKDLPNTRRHALAQKAAEAARCASEQGKFWQYHDLLLTRQENVAQGLSPDVRPEGLSYFIQLARELNLDSGTFMECLESERTKDIVTRTFNEALLLQVDATPYFFIGERRISGVISFIELQSIIDAALK